MKREFEVPGEPPIVYEYPLRPKLYCDRCGKPVYLVQAPTGERFLISHDGTNSCTA